MLMNDGRKRVAAIVTEYRIRSHADNIVTRLLQGYALSGMPVPSRLEVASLYTDQVPDNDISRDLAAAHGVPIFPTIKEALTLGGDTLAVDGVVIVGEHGQYGFNEKGQHLYPRREFFEQVVAVFRQSGRVVPFFSDKHLSYSWENAKWIYDTAQELSIPFMAGSSMPLAVRCPPLFVPEGADVEEIVVVAQGGLESYGFHALEIGQCLAEWRAGGEKGVAAVQCLTGQAFLDALRDAPHWSRALEQAALATLEHASGSLAEHFAAHPASEAGEGRGGIFLVEYGDGLRLTVMMLSGYVLQWAAAVRLRGQEKPLAAAFLQPRSQPLTNFDSQADFIVRMVESGRSLIPLERTLLTTGALDALMTSRHAGGRRVETPHLAVSYRPPSLPPFHVRSYVILGRATQRLR